MNKVILFQISLLLSLLLVSSYVGQQARFQDTHFVPRSVHQEVKWDPLLFKFFTLGHWPAGVDFLWMRALQDPAYTWVQRGEHPRSFFDIDLLTDLDPLFFDAYYEGAALIYVIRDDASGASILLEKAEKFYRTNIHEYPKTFRDLYWKDPWALPFLLSFIQLFEERDLEKASEALDRAAESSTAPLHIRALAKRIKTPEGQFIIANRVLTGLIEGEKREEVLSKVRRRKTALDIQYILFKIHGLFIEDLQKRGIQMTLIQKDREKAEKYFSEFLQKHPRFQKDPSGGKVIWTENGVSSQTDLKEYFMIKDFWGIS